jgi:dTDP-4-amino-4,6-dideoxygalactose transaminase
MNPLLPNAEAVRPYLESMDRARRYANYGPLVAEFENRLAREVLAVEPARVVVCASGTVALIGALKGAGCDDAVVPAFTFPATPLAAMQAGYQVSFCDVDPDSWLPSRSARPGSGKVALVPVLPFGAPMTFTPFADWEHVVIEAAASIGSGGAALSSMPSAWAAVFSLHATKVLGIGE